MSKITVNLQPEPKRTTAINAPPLKTPNEQPPLFASHNPDFEPRRKGSWLRKIVLGLLVVFLLAAAVGGIGGYWWWTNLQKSPQYALALLIDAARKDDQAAVEKYLDTNAVVDDFVPQITDKAKERYGRGFPPQIVARATQQLQPLLTQILPQIKETARREAPRLIKEKAASAPNYSPWITASGLKTLVNVEETGDTAILKAAVQNRNIELKMQRSNGQWKIIGAKDDQLADKIADQVAQKILASVNQRQTTGKAVSNKDLIQDITKQLEQITP